MHYLIVYAWDVKKWTEMIIVITMGSQAGNDLKVWFRLNKCSISNYL